MGVLTVVLAVTIIGYLLFRKWRQQQDKKLPPSPWKLPFVGHLFFLHPKKPQETLRKWGKEYGSIYRVYFGSDEVLVLNSYDVVREAFVKQADVFGGRPNNWLFEVLQDGEKRGVINAEGAKWMEQRRFSLRHLRDLGMGRSIMEHKVEFEIDKLIEVVDKKLETNNDAVDLILEINYCIANIICSIVFGHVFQRGDPEFEKFHFYLKEISRLVGYSGFLMAFPWMRYVIPGGLGFWSLLKYTRECLAFYRKQIDRCKKSLNSENQETNYITAYLKEIKKREASGDDELHYFNEQQLMFTLGDFFFAGQETTVTTLRWAILYLMENVEIQEIIYEEIKANVGQRPLWKDREKCPYLLATTLESLRLGHIAPFGVMHRTVKAQVDESPGHRWCFKNVVKSPVTRNKKRDPQQSC